jgi:hypothetical protein
VFLLLHPVTCVGHFLSCFLSSFVECTIDISKIPTRWHCTVVYYFLSVALHVSGISHAHHQEIS